jgi:alkylation response protein AidB-like acyl-CoA dehydrogenase
MDFDPTAHQCRLIGRRWQGLCDGGQHGQALASEGAAEISAEAMRLSGGRGYFLDDRLIRTWRESALALFAGGTSEIQRNGIARGLGL